VSAPEALKAAKAAGIKLRVEGCDLALEANAPPPADLLERLARLKPEIVALLRPGRDGWLAEDWQAYFDERASIAEFDGGLPRPEAEARAFECCVVEWLNRNFEHSPPGHISLRSSSWPAWYAGRNAKAVAALKAMGIVPPPKFPDDFGKNRGA
jgi:hypothetical protein